MKKNAYLIFLFVVFLLMISGSAVAQQNEAAYTYNAEPDERVPLFYEPHEEARLFGEYFNGVKVNVLERLPDEWVKIQIVTHEGADGLQMYTQSRYLVFDEEGEQVEKTTILFEVNVDQLYMHNSATEQSTYSGPLGMNEYVELLGLIVPLHVFTDNPVVQRPIDLNTSMAHIKTGNVTGFLDDISLLKRSDPYEM